MGKAIVIASGKGGVGKSTLSVALGQALADSSRVCVIDTDIGLRDLDLLMNLESRVVYDLLDVCRKKCRLSLALIQHTEFPQLYLLPASQFARSDDLERRQLSHVLHRLKQRFDWVILDAPAGIEHGLRAVLQKEVDECIVVCTPDDVCIRNAERTAALARDKGIPEVRLVVNRLVPELIAGHEMYSAVTVAQTLDLPLLGELPEDPVLYRAQLKHLPLCSCACPASEAVLRIAGRLSGKELPLPAYGSEKRSWFARHFRRLKEVTLR